MHSPYSIFALQPYLMEGLCYILTQHYLRSWWKAYFPHNIYSTCTTHNTSLLFALQPYWMDGLRYIYHQNYLPSIWMPILSIMSIQHAQAILHHYSLHFNLTERKVYITCTSALTPFYTVGLLFVQHAQTLLVSWEMGDSFFWASRIFVKPLLNEPVRRW